MNEAAKPWVKRWEDIEYAEVTEQTVRLHLEAVSEHSSACTHVINTPLRTVESKSLAPNDQQGKTKNISFSDPKICSLVYAYLVHYSHKMSRPGDMTNPEQLGEVGGAENEASKLFSALSVVDGYKFGTANKDRAARQKFRDDDQIIGYAQSSLLEPWSSGDWKSLDKRVWGLVSDWDKVHTRLQACRCCAVLILNQSDVSIHISAVELLEGLDKRVLVGPNYDTDARSILPGGWIVAFAWAYSPSPLRTGHVKMQIRTTGFLAGVGSKRRWATIQNAEQVDATFNEKSLSDWWSKFTIVLSPKRYW